MKRRKFTSKFKTKVVLEAIKERQSAKELAERFKLTPQQISTWKREFLDNADQVFDGNAKNKKSEEEERNDELLRVIGQQKVEIDFLKKSLM
ncbi:MAG: helix-turn-helix domain-containing protein [Saprospiraceae bacterium]|nr:helix-turn-helix domain-containing protein [Saprospiraceae bacterium]